MSFCSLMWNFRNAVMRSFSLKEFVHQIKFKVGDFLKESRRTAGRQNKLLQTKKHSTTEVCLMFKLTNKTTKRFVWKETTWLFITELEEFIIISPHLDWAPKVQAGAEPEGCPRCHHWHLAGHPRRHPQINDKWVGTLDFVLQLDFAQIFFSDTPECVCLKNYLPL